MKLPLALPRLLVLATVAASLGCTPPSPACGSDDDCAVSESCVEGACSRAPANVAVTSFIARPSRIGPGQSSTLSWETRNAASCALSTAGVVPRVGSIEVSPLATTPYELSCSGAEGPAVASVTVEVVSVDAGQGDDGGPAQEDGGLADGGASDDGGAPDGGLVDGGAENGFPVGRSCSELRFVHGAEEDGLYTLDPDGESGALPPFQAFCDMTTEGGGWTLVLKADGTQPTFEYDSPLWTDFETLNPESPLPDGTEAKLPGFASLPVDQLRLSMRTEGLLRAATLPLKAADLRSAFASGDVTATGSDANDWLTLIPGAVLQPNPCAEGLNADGTYTSADGARVRIGMLGDDAQDCYIPDSWVGVGGGTNSCVDFDPPGYTTGGGACWLASSAVEAVAATAHVYVRDLELTGLPAEPSCATHKARGRDVSGYYRVTLPDSSVVRVYCEMEVDGGGWMLVARSVESGLATGPFGWHASTGAPDDFEAAYSLGALGHEAIFSEVLVARRGTNQQIESHAYRLAVPPDLFTSEAYSVSFAAPTPPVAVLGECQPGASSMLKYLGYTVDENGYFLRDSAGFAPFGLLPHGFETGFDDCEKGAKLNGEQGLLFVR